MLDSFLYAHETPKSNAGRQARLAAVACTPWLGPYAAAQAFNGKELLSVSGLPLIPSLGGVSWKAHVLTQSRPLLLQ